MVHRVLIAGHSLIRHLLSHDLDPNLHLPIDVDFHAISGARISDFFHDHSFLEKLRYNDTLFLQLGQNDIQASSHNFSQSTIQLLDQALRLINIIKRCNPNIKIFWGQFLFRQRSQSRHCRIRTMEQQQQFNAQITIINRRLRRILSHEPSVFFWRHVGATINCLHMLTHDGIHLNSRGNLNLWRLIRGAVISSIRCK